VWESQRVGEIEEPTSVEMAPTRESELVRFETLASAIPKAGDLMKCSLGTKTGVEAGY
jgi:hypothetical protein